ncbi:Origin of replication complex subunit 6 [Castilleja foliolosa]|uniref:Origin of replication complex subunit 6 n=1 Tax=Castilleja foliolosa TaxID=1961234 RepID=A0ABD3BVE0_9LAMI
MVYGGDGLSWRGGGLPRLADVEFDSSIIDVTMQVIFDRQAAIRMSGMSEKAYNRSFNSMQNGNGVKNKLDIRELAIQFGCVRPIPFAHKGISLYKERFLASLPISRRGSTDFNRSVFTGVAFYLCAKTHKLFSSGDDDEESTALELVQIQQELINLKGKALLLESVMRESMEL